MPPGIKYVLMTLVFVILTKVLQVAAFDSKHYEKLQRESAESYYSKKAKSKKGAKKPSKKEKEVMKASDDNQEDSTLKPKTQAKEETAASDTQASPYSDVTLSSLKNNYLAPLLATIPEGQLREDIVIRYYRHKKDLQKVDRLKALSYYIHEKEAIETAGLGSNIIYYGDDVPLEDIQIIAFTLLEEGIPLKSIKHTQFEWKAKAIEIGTDTLLINEANISIQEIQNFHKQYVGS